MWLEGKIERDDDYWMISIPMLGAATQGKTEEDAYSMLGDLILSFLLYPEGLSVTYKDKKEVGESRTFLVSTSDPLAIFTFARDMLNNVKIPYAIN